MCTIGVLARRMKAALGLLEEQGRLSPNHHQSCEIRYEMHESRGRIGYGTIFGLQVRHGLCPIAAIEAPRTVSTAILQRIVQKIVWP
jgi:hypothetical protein